MFGATTTATAVLASISGVTAEIFPDILPYLLVAIGIPVAFVIARYLISLFKHGVGRSR
jgi:hypothetical protein